MDAPEINGNVYFSDEFDAKQDDQLWLQNNSCRRT